MFRTAILTSGGDAPGMNAAIRSLVRFGINEGFEIFGIYHGFEGLIDGNFHQLNRRSVGDILHRGGTILKTARSKRFMTEEGIEKAINNLRKYKIDCLVVIGGNGSFKGALELSKRGINIIGIPGTIDNDLGYTDRTIGFDTAVNTVLEAVSRVRDTSSSHDRTTVMEVMGRDCGDIALYSGIAGGAEAVLLPEVSENINDLCKKIYEGCKKGKKHGIIIKAEGYPVESVEIVRALNETLEGEVRLVVLSYIQRGGSPTLSDRLLATEFGGKAVELMKKETYSVAIGIKKGEITEFDLEEAIAQKRKFDIKKYKAIDILSR